MSALEQALGRATVVAEEAAAATRAAPVDPAIRAALVEAGAADGADADRLWRATGERGPEGARLVRRAIVVVAREMRDGAL